jgi:hypothetical protein
VTQRAFFCKAGDAVFALDHIARIDFSRIEELRLTVHLKDGSQHQAFDIEALELAMQTKPSALEGRRLAFARRAWWIHNFLAHPLMQILAGLGAYKLAFLVHDRTVPMPLGAKASRSGASRQR